MNTGSGYLLIVEDDPDILKLLQTTLTFKGYRVVTARNGREGLDLVRADRPAIVIADIMMPKLDGFGLVHRLRLDPQTCDIPVVFITATYVAPEDKEFALNIGATRFLQKPVDLDAFLKTIQELLHSNNLPLAIEPMHELKFYEGYRHRLEIKLDQKIKQIARDELLLKTRPDLDSESLQASLRHAIEERQEIMLLLEQVREQAEKFSRNE
ncbi:MAG TPA: response regulator [Anaerolineales bacterium]|nr:response regulator [Anaerolineales bacterium]